MTRALCTCGAYARPCTPDECRYRQLADAMMEEDVVDEQDHATGSCVRCGNTPEQGHDPGCGLTPDEMMGRDATPDRAASFPSLPPAPARAACDHPRMERFMSWAGTGHDMQRTKTSRCPDCGASASWIVGNHA